MRIGTVVRWTDSVIDLSVSESGVLSVQIETLVPDGILERCLAEDLRTHEGSVTVVGGMLLAHLPNALLSDTASVKALIEESAYTAERQYRESVGV